MCVWGGLQLDDVEVTQCEARTHTLKLANTHKRTHRDTHTHTHTHINPTYVPQEPPVFLSSPAASRAVSKAACGAALRCCGGDQVQMGFSLSDRPASPLLCFILLCYVIYCTDFFFLPSLALFYFMAFLF